MIVRVTSTDLSDSARLSRRLPEALAGGRRIVGLGGIIGSAKALPVAQFPR